MMEIIVSISSEKKKSKKNDVISYVQVTKATLQANTITTKVKERGGQHYRDDGVIYILTDL